LLWNKETHKALRQVTPETVLFKLLGAIRSYFMISLLSHLSTERLIVQLKQQQIPGFSW